MHPMKPDINIIDQQIVNLKQTRDVVLMPSLEAWQKYPWTQQFYKNKPELGYFLWIKKTQKQPLSSCISLEATGSQQRLSNLVVLEPSVSAKLNAVCNTLKPETTGTHHGKSQIILKKNSSLKINHQHVWGSKNLSLPQITFNLHQQSQLSYLYKNTTSPKKLSMKNKIFLKQGAKAETKIIIDSKEGQVDIDESLYLNGSHSSGTMILRLLARDKARFSAKSKIEAKQAGKGHLDCQGLLIGDNAQIDLIPQLINKNKQALITHEASIGRIEKEKLEYLQSRGFTHKKAIDLIVKGFLKLPLDK
jgi:Fe-S cluster assembly scaffold protein SufB